MSRKLYTFNRPFQYEQDQLWYMIQYGQTKSTSYLTNVMPMNADVTNVTDIYFFKSKCVVPINIVLSKSVVPINN